jgi:anti-sigma B factor antagonist
MALKVTTEEKGSGIHIIRPVGSIDAHTHPILGSQVDTIFTRSPRLIIFDMKDVQYISSAGISVVLSAEKSLNASGGKVLLVNLQPQIRKVFDIVQALPRQQIFANVEEMDAYLAAIQRKVKEGEIE